MEQRFLTLHVSATYILIYGVLASFYPFLTYYFQERGLSYTEMGMGFALVSLTSVMAQPVWGFIADKYSNKRTILLITLLSSSVAVYLLILASGFNFVMGSIFLVMIFQSPLTPVADAYAYALIKEYGCFEYGKIRLMGSFGYAVVALFLGWAIQSYGINSSYLVYSLACWCGVYFVSRIDFKDKGTRRKVNRQEIIRLLNNKKMLLLLGAIMFTNIAIGSNGSYIAILIEKTGGDVANLGMVWFLVAISELPAFYWGAKLLRRYGELNLYILGLILFVVRYILLSQCSWYIPVLVIQLMQGMTYTFFVIASLEYLNRIAPGNLKTVAMTMQSAAIALGGVIGNLGGGVLLEYISIFALYKALAVSCMIAIGILAVLKKGG